MTKGRYGKWSVDSSGNVSINLSDVTTWKGDHIGAIGSYGGNPDTELGNMSLQMNHGINGEWNTVGAKLVIYGIGMKQVFLFVSMRLSRRGLIIHLGRWSLRHY